MSADAIKIRKALPEEDGTIGELLVRAFVDTYAKKMPEVVVTERRKADLRNVEARRANGLVLVAVEKDHIVGTVSLIPYGKEGSEAWSPDANCLRMMVVDPEHHSKGISKKMILACIEETRRMGLKAIELHIRHGAVGLDRMYTQFGFKRTPSADMDLRPEIFLDAYRLELP